MIKEIMIYLIRALNPVVLRRVREKQIQMIEQIVTLECYSVTESWLA